MVVRFGAVFEGGLFRPTGPVDLPEGTAVELSVVAPSPPSLRNPQAVYDRIMAVANLPTEPGEDVRVTSQNVDEVLYGDPNGVR